MLLGNRVQQAIHVAAKLGIADLLADGPMSADALANATGAHPGGLYRLLRALTGFNIFAQDAEGRFELTPLAELLQTNPRSKRAFALWSGGVNYRLFGELEYSVMTGEPAFDHLFGTEFFDYLAQNPETGYLFDEFMSRQTAPVGPVIAAYDFTGDNVVVDVAGGRGELVAAILAAHPEMRGVLIDEQRVIDGARRVLSAAGVADRCETICGDITKSVPQGGDVYILKSVVHSMTDHDAAQLLTKCKQAMNEGGKLLLVELVMPAGNEPHPARLMDLLMLAGTHGGYERTEEQFRALFADAGLQLTNLLHTKYAYSIIEARAS
jgi:cyclopropane fatty-acyl-phospholipid synthase-like methyltransferase